MKKYNPILFSLAFTFIVLTVIALLLLVYRFFNPGVSLLLFIILFLYGFIPPITILSCLYMVGHNEEWTKKYKWVAILYILLMISWWFVWIL